MPRELRNRARRGASKAAEHDGDASARASGRPARRSDGGTTTMTTTRATKSSERGDAWSSKGGGAAFAALACGIAVVLGAYTYGMFRWFV